MNPHDISIEDFDYELPEHRIPKYPLEQRDMGKLLFYKNESICDYQFRDICQLLPEKSILIFNDSEVLPVRLFFFTSANKKIEIFCLESIREEGDWAEWKCFVGGASKWREGNLHIQKDDFAVEASLIHKERSHCIVRFQWSGNITSSLDMLQIFGQIPIPPYLNRNSEDIDTIRYQNVFAYHKGSVAAPTAGLHFTENLIQEISEGGITIDFVTLHVGAGTFQPVKSETIGGHQMHMERVVITKDFVQNLIEQLHAGLPVVAVGTTTLRSLESLYWLGVKIGNEHPGADADLKVEQWSPYDQNQQSISAVDSLMAILNYMQKAGKNVLQFSTELLILPSYNFKIINCLVTNFHQPKSTLLLLVAAAVGDNWKKIYNHALENDYRFLSYGDASLLFVQ